MCFTSGFFNDLALRDRNKSIDIAESLLAFEVGNNLSFPQEIFVSVEFDIDEVVEGGSRKKKARREGRASG